MATTGDSTGADAAPEIAETLGHYRLLGEAGRGGMSVVYEAMDDRFGRRVALKALAFPLASSQDLRNATVARFKREARAVASLSHPNVVTIFDIGEERRQHYLVMEFLEGRTLKERLQEGPLPPTEAAHVLDQLAAGLDAVHAAGIIHRDVKPSNVMLLPGGRVKLMDFGVARGSEDTLVTQAGMMVGSPAYMSPEQIHGEALGPACDVWALGVLTYEMLAGHPPFAGSTIPKVVYQVTHDAPPKLPGVSPAVQNVLKRALAKNPAQRYGTAREMAEAFRAALSPAAATAPSPAPPPRQPRPLLRPPAPRARLAAPPRPVLWAGGLLLIALLAALPQALHPRHAPGVRVVYASPPALPPRRVPAAHTVVVRVASYWKERRSQAAASARALDRRRPAQERTARRRLARQQAGRVASLPEPLPQGQTREKPREQPEEQAARPEPPVYKRRRVETPPKIAERESASPRLASLKTSLPADMPPTETPLTPAVIKTEAGQSLLGTWRGHHTRNPAVLDVTHQEGNTFTGTMSVRTHEASVRIAVEGRVSPSGDVTLRERRILSSTAPRAWDLGSESGRLAGEGRMEGMGTDVKGRVGAWSFSR